MKPRHDATPLDITVQDLRASVRRDAVRFSSSDEQTERAAAAQDMRKAWETLHAKVLESRLASTDLSFVSKLADDLRATATSEENETRLAALNRFSLAFQRVANAVSALGTPFEPGAAWRPNTEPLSAEEKAVRLERVRERTKQTARTLTEAVHVVLRVRGEEGIPLYATRANESNAAYATAAQSYAMVSVMPPGFSPAPPTTSPWGVFRVQSDVPAEQAESRFAVSPPLPQRVDTMEGRTTPIRFAALHSSENAANHDEGSDNAGQ